MGDANDNTGATNTAKDKRDGRGLKGSLHDPR